MSRGTVDPVLMDLEQRLRKIVRSRFPEPRQQDPGEWRRCGGKLRLYTNKEIRRLNEMLDAGASQQAVADEFGLRPGQAAGLIYRERQRRGERPVRGVVKLTQP